MCEVHIFDFDGTLFYSPAPTHTAVTSFLSSPGTQGAAPSTSDDTAAAAQQRLAEESNKLYGSLLNPVDAGGYGWFQNLHTMSPPAVPAKPDPAVWFVAPILSHMRALVKRREEQLRNPEAATGDMPLLYVLTGRDVKYYDRIWTLLQQVGLDKEVEDVILKPHETAGTVHYKLNNFFRIIQHHEPSRVFYYEDRVEQGGRLLEGIRVLEEVLYSSSNSSSGNGGAQTAVVDRVGVVTFDVTAAPATAPPAQGGAVHSPQPAVNFQFAASSSSSPANGSTDPRLAGLTSTLRGSPDALLRDACYPLDRLAAFYHDPVDVEGTKAQKAADQAERQARRWVEGTIDFWNAKSEPARGGRGGRSGAGGRGGRGALTAKKTPAATFDADALHKSIRFRVAPSFTFLMVLVPSALCDRSNDMLGADQFAALVKRLKVEREERAKR